MAKKKMLIFAHYYAPDTASTGQILQDQAEGMKDDFDITVICTVPSYTGKIEEKYKTQKVYNEEINGVKVVRVRVPEFTKANKVSRIKNIIAYYFGARKACRHSGPQDYIFTISQPPILGGMLGVSGKRMKKAKMIYCIQDFNPEQTIAVKYAGNKLVLRAMMMMDKRSCRKSDLVITVGRDLVETLEKRFAGQTVPKHVMINNWIDEKQIYPLPADNEGVVRFREGAGLLDKFVIMYSGNIGLYYDLENILKVIETFKPGTRAKDGREVAFAFVGEGSVLDKLKVYAAERGMTNVLFLPYQDKDKLIYSLNAADVHWCVNARGIKGVSCPSKFYGIAAVAKPVLGVLEKGSEVRMLIEDTGCGLVCEPGEYDQIAENICAFLSGDDLAEMGRRGYEYLVRNLTKDVSIRKYSEEIQKL